MLHHWEEITITGLGRCANLCKYTMFHLCCTAPIVVFCNAIFHINLRLFLIIYNCVSLIFAAYSHQTSHPTVMCPRCVPRSSTALPRTAVLCIIPWLPVWLLDQDQDRGLATAWINIWGPPRPHHHTVWWATGACRPQSVSQSIFYISLISQLLLIWI